MLDRVLLVALTPLALAGGTATSWLQQHWAGSRTTSPIAASPTPGRVGAGTPLAMFKGSDGLLHTLVRINGVQVDMVVDTGASRTILSTHDAQRLFPGDSGNRSGHIRTLGGDRELRVQTAARVEIAGQSFHQLEAGLVDDAPVSVMGLDWLALVGPITIAPQS